MAPVSSCPLIRPKNILCRLFNLLPLVDTPLSVQDIPSLDALPRELLDGIVAEALGGEGDIKVNFSLFRGWRVLERKDIDREIVETIDNLAYNDEESGSEVMSPFACISNTWLHELSSTRF